MQCLLKKSNLIYLEESEITKFSDNYHIKPYNAHHILAHCFSILASILEVDDCIYSHTDTQSFKDIKSGIVIFFITEQDIEEKLKKIINTNFIESLFFNLSGNQEFKQFFNHDKNDEWAPFNIHQWTNDLDDKLTKIIQISLFNFWLDENLIATSYQLPSVKI